MAQCSNASDALVPLRKWIEREAEHQILSRRQTAGFGDEKHDKDVILRKTTIAYGLAESLMHARARHSIDPSLSSACKQFGIDNFVVRFSDEGAAAGHFQPRWNDITGVDMLSPPISMNIAEPSFLRNVDGEASDDGEDQITGRYLEVEFPTLPESGSTVFAVSQSEEDARCRSLGEILYQLFSHISPFADEGHTRGKKCFITKDCTKEERKNDVSQEPAHKRKKTRLLGSTSIVTQNQESQETPYRPLIDLGFPSSICLLVRNLLECGYDNDNRPDHAYDSLETVSKDLHLLLLDPSRFLFDREPTPENGSIQLSFRNHKLYGRENEVSLITDAFCRVSTGKSEAFFIGGFSGSGKSRLVNSLTARVDINEGYVLTHKFDQISKERPLLEVISVFNDLCLLVREKRSQQELLAIAKDLKESFGADFSLLARLLPNIVVISPQLSQIDHVKESGGRMNMEGVCFILRRFMKVVSSKSHPVMLFLDDLQWCDDSALALIGGTLCDVSGCSYLFFVGSYRSNQVKDDHGIFHLMDNLNSSGVPTTKLSLEGLTPKDLNTMVSDAMCMFPRICEPLSDIVFQKTKVVLHLSVLLKIPFFF